MISHKLQTKMNLCSRPCCRDNESLSIQVTLLVSVSWCCTSHCKAKHKDTLHAAYTCISQNEGDFLPLFFSFLG